MDSGRIVRGETFSSRRIFQRITRHPRDLKKLHRISESKHTSEHKYNTLNTLS